MVEVRRQTILADSFLLLGAGASVDAGVPAAVRFLEVIRRELEAHPPGDRAALLAAYQQTLAAVEADPEERAGLEPFYEKIDDCLDAHFQRRPTRDGLRASRALERLHYETKRTIQRHCDVTDPAQVGYLQPLLRSLSRLAPYPIVSFNYDSVVETACRAAGLGFAEGVLGEDPGSRDFELIKVHGSVTWLSGAKGGLARNVRYASGAMRRFGELRSPTLDTPMIYPSRRKMPIHDPFMRNALRLQELLADKKRSICIAVGYSFPDLHVRSWLDEAMKARPELLLYIVGPDPTQTLINLTANLPTLNWTERLRVVTATFKDAINGLGGFEAALGRAVPFGPDFAGTMASPRLGPFPRCFAGKASGLGAAPDGSAVYVSDPQRGAVLRIMSGDLEAKTFAAGLREPRGISVTPDGRVRVVQNRLFRSSRIPTAGAGSVVEFDPRGRRRLLASLRLSELRAIPTALRAGKVSAQLWEELPSLLRWPTDIASTSDDAVYVTEARALTRVSAERAPNRLCRTELAFNLHGLDAADDGALVGVEQGISQAASWGRVLRYAPSGDGADWSVSSQAEGLSRLMGLCFVHSRRQVVVTQALTWPYGALLVLDYPGLDNLRVLRGFDFPQKIAYVSGRELLAVSFPTGVDLIPVVELDRATPAS